MDTPLLLQSRVDALRLAYEGEPLRERLIELSTLQAQARHRGAWVSVAEQLFEVCTTGGGGMEFRLRNSDATVLMGQGQHGVGVIVEPRAMYLAENGVLDVCLTAEQIAEELLGRPLQGVRVRRLDLCADAAGISFTRDDVDNFVSRARKVTHYATHAKRAGGSAPCTGFAIGKGGETSVRLYDKTEELRSQQQPDSHKVRTEHEIWREAGWDGVAPVWRLEVQLKGAALDQFGARVPWAIPEQLDPLWRYMIGIPGGVEAWLRLTLAGSASRRERRSVDPRWVVYQGANFHSLTKSMATRVQGHRGGALVEQALGGLLSCLGSRAELGPTESPPLEQLESDLQRFLELVRGTQLEASYAARREAARARFAQLTRNGTAESTNAS